MADIQKIPPSPPIRPADKRSRPLRPGKDKDLQPAPHPGNGGDKDPDDKGIDEYA